MEAKKFRLVMIGLLGLSIVVFIAMGILGLSMLGSKSQNMVGLKLQGDKLDAQLSSLGQAKKQIEQYSYFKDVAQTVIPSDKDQAQAVLDIFQFAGQAGISIQNITFPSSTLGASISALGAPAATGNAQTASPKDVLSQAQAVTGISGLYSIPLTITPATGGQVPASLEPTYPKILDFLNRIEQNRRTAQITQITIQPLSGTVGGQQIINFTLTLNIFIKP